jgi:hypothetical protein
VCVCEYMGGVWRVCKLEHLYENYWERKKEKLECQMTEKLHKRSKVERKRGERGKEVDRKSDRKREGETEGRHQPK